MFESFYKKKVRYGKGLAVLVTYFHTLTEEHICCMFPLHLVRDFSVQAFQ